MAEEKNIVSIDAFLAQNVKPADNQEVTLKRFSVPFVIRALTQDEISDLQKQSTKRTTVKGVLQESTDTIAFSNALVEAALVQPDLNNAKLQSSYGTPGQPTKTLKKMLLGGEFADLASKVQELSGYEPEDLDSKSDDLKN
ncbi:hypothetical protein PQ472_05215 [Lacticaseibacillus pabuli]|uniref:XkdN-like tail assembly chaperone n=1 Tax=Lacticaseibacillus pabuli TaxID=3025672 RepID=A0ABY7WTZ5_9LACO|nr:hypothetical protein [Lacticaseibacillus sp. KACC 23028]WDF83637.1 hypothetical protein PQ472_05215 [Lacticaseibacillus sp. KACC 23028]